MKRALGGVWRWFRSLSTKMQVVVASVLVVGLFGSSAGDPATTPPSQDSAQPVAQNDAAQARPSSAQDGVVTAAQYGDDWPLKVEQARVLCEQLPHGEAVSVEATASATRSTAPPRLTPTSRASTASGRPAKHRHQPRQSLV